MNQERKEQEEIFGVVCNFSSIRSKRRIWKHEARKLKREIQVSLSGISKN